MNINYADSCNFKPIPAITPLDGYWQNGTWKFNMSEISAGAASQPSWINVILKGNTALTLVNAKANGLNYLKLYGGCEQRNLPSGYTQLEFLQSDGACYIDLLRVPNNDDIIEQKFQKLGTSTTTCSWYGSMPSSQIITPRIGIGAFSNQGVYTLFAGSNYTGPISAADTNVHTLRFQTTGERELTYTLDGVTSVITAPTETTNMYEPAVELTSYLFARHGTNGVQVYDNEGTKIYYHREYLANGTLALNVVPAKRNSDNVLGMYDLVSGQFLTNKGTGSFTAGSVAVPTPNTPMDIVCNNGAIKNSPNLVNVVADNVDLGHYISSTGVYSESVSNFLYVPYIKVQPNTTYTLSFSEELYYITISEYSANDGTGFIQRTAGTTGGNTSLTVTTQATTNYIRFGSNPYGNSNTVTMEQVLAINWMLAKADTPQTYIPYGQIYTDGVIETVISRGVNLFNKSSYEEITAYVNANTGVLTQGTTQKCAVIPCEPNTTYIITNRTTSAWGSFTDKTIGSAATAFITTSNILTTGANDRYLIGLVRTTDGTYDYRDTLNVSVYGGSATAEMLLKLGDYQDVQSVLDGEVTRNASVLVLDGTENWSYNAQYSRFQTSTTTIPVAASRTLPFISTHYQVIYSTTTHPGYIYNGSNRQLMLTDAHTSVEDFQQWLAEQYNAGTPVIILCPLAISTTETVTAQPLTIQAGTNIVEITQASIDNLELEVSFKQATI